MFFLFRNSYGKQKQIKFKCLKEIMREYGLLDDLVFKFLNFPNNTFLLKLLLITCVKCSARNNLVDPIHSEFTVSCIGHVIDGYKFPAGKLSNHMYITLSGGRKKKTKVSSVELIYPESEFIFMRD